MSGSEERNIAPSPRRVADARRAGGVPRSQHFTAAVSLFAGSVVICVLGHKLWNGMIELLQAAWSAPVVRADAPDASAAVAGPLQRIALLLTTMLVIPGIAALFGAALQSGFCIRLRMPRSGWRLLNPRSGWRRIGSGFHLGSLSGMGVSVAAACLLTSWMVNRSRPAVLKGESEVSAAVNIGELSSLGLLLGSIFLLLGAGDWILQRRRFLRSLRMTMAEAREEARAAKSPRGSRTRRRRGVSPLGIKSPSEQRRVPSPAFAAAKADLSADPQIS